MARSAAPFSRRILLKSLAALGLLGSLVAADASDALSVSLDTARAEFEAGRVVLIDIREPNEHATGVARGARLLPMSQLGQRLSEISGRPEAARAADLQYAEPLQPHAQGAARAWLRPRALRRGRHERMGAPRLADGQARPLSARLPAAPAYARGEIA